MDKSTSLHLLDGCPEWSKVGALCVSVCSFGWAQSPTLSVLLVTDPFMCDRSAPPMIPIYFLCLTMNVWRGLVGVLTTQRRNPNIYLAACSCSPHQPYLPFCWNYSYLCHTVLKDDPTISQPILLKTHRKHIPDAFWYSLLYLQYS